MNLSKEYPDKTIQLN